MTPYHHYPRVGLLYCRCDHCGNEDWRDRMLSRILDRRWKTLKTTPTPKYKLRRRHRLTPRIKPKLRPSPPYKLRREHQARLKSMLEAFGESKRLGP